MQFDLGTIDPTETSGVELADILTQWKGAVQSNHAGDVRPTYAVDNMTWMDNSGSEVIWKYYDQANDVDLEIGRFVTTTGTFRPANVDPESFATSTAVDVNATDNDSNRVVVFTAAADLNLPLPAGVRDSWKIKVVAVGGNVAVNAASPSLVDGEVSLVVQEGTSTTIYVVGDNYFTDLNFKFSSGGVPVGTILYFSTPTAPDGFLICDGTAVTDLYPDLKALLVAAGNPFGTSGGNPKLPDEITVSRFRRAANGSLPVGTVQADQMQGHWHTKRAFSNVSNIANTGNTSYYIDSPISLSSVDAKNSAGQSFVQDAISDGVNGTPRVGSETRPNSIAYLPCIKAFGAVSPEGMADLAALLTAIATEAEAIAGLNNTQIMTPLRTRQQAVSYADARTGWETILDYTTTGPLAAIDVNNLGAYRDLHIEGWFRPVTDSVNLYLRTSEDNGATFSAGASDYGLIRSTATGSATSAIGGNAPAMQLNFAGAIGNVGPIEAIHFDARLFNFNKAEWCKGRVNCGYFNPSSASYAEFGDVWRQGSLVHNAIRFAFSSGNISAGGYLRIWGIKG